MTPHTTTQAPHPRAREIKFNQDKRSSSSSSAFTISVELKVDCRNSEALTGQCLAMEEN